MNLKKPMIVKERRITTIGWRSGRFVEKTI
jgi:hypothetical protein